MVARKIVFAICILLMGCSPAATEPISEETPHAIPLASDVISRETASKITLLDSLGVSERPFNNELPLPDGRILIIGDWAGRLKYNFSNEDEQCQRSIHDSTPSFNENYTLVIWCTGNLKIINRKDDSSYLYSYPDSGKFYGIAITPDKEHLALSLDNGSIWFIPIDKNWEQELRLNHTDKIHLVPQTVIDLQGRVPLVMAFSADGSLMILVFENWEVQVWDLQEMSLLSSIESPFQPQVISFSPGNMIMAILSKNGTINLWDLETSHLLTTLDGNQEEIVASTFSSNGQFLLSLDASDKLYIWGISPQIGFDEMIETATAAAQLSSTPTRTPIVLPSPTFTPTFVPKSLTPIFSWAVLHPSKSQIDEIRNCKVDELALQRYPDRDAFWQINNFDEIRSSCDWGVLALAYINHSQSSDRIPEQGKQAFLQAIKLNPSIAFATPLFYDYLDVENLVDIPPSFDQPIKRVVIDYEWRGIGEPSYVSHYIVITQSNPPTGMIKVITQSQPKEFANELNNSFDPMLFQDLGSALTDFLPVQASFSLETCTDNSPDWKIDISFLDNTTLRLQTYGSNLFTIGGPWQIQIKGLNYMQFSASLPKAISELFNGLKLPLGQPYAMYCYREDVFDKAFPP